jgi:hypothetical protein
MAAYRSLACIKRIINGGGIEIISSVWLAPSAWRGGIYQRKASAAAGGEKRWRQASWRREKKGSGGS